MVISAVDCRHIFRDDFGKTHTYGYSPMDLGTGLFVAVRALDSLRRDLRKVNFFQAELPTTGQNSADSEKTATPNQKTMSRVG